MINNLMYSSFEVGVKTAESFKEYLFPIDLDEKKT